MSDKTREEFEAWASEKGINIAWAEKQLKEMK
jgi:hypothetical protein